VAFTKVVTIYHSWIRPLHHSPLTPLPQSRNSFSGYHFSMNIHVYILDTDLSRGEWNPPFRWMTFRIFGMVLSGGILPFSKWVHHNTQPQPSAPAATVMRACCMKKRQHGGVEGVGRSRFSNICLHFLFLAKRPFLWNWTNLLSCKHQIVYYFI
jgi:hypothetical protein